MGSRLVKAKCPCGQPLEIKTVYNLSLHVEAEVVTCPCGKIRKHYETDPARAAFIQFTQKQMGNEVGKSCKLNVTSEQKFRALADSL